jgi:hypothetical protein
MGSSWYDVGVRVGIPVEVWYVPVARDPGPGNPILFGTTDLFLEKLGINSVDDLPPIAAFVPGPDVVEQLEHGLRAEIDLRIDADLAEGSADAGPDAAVDVEDGAGDPVVVSETVDLVETDEGVVVTTTTDSIEVVAHDDPGITETVETIATVEIVGPPTGTSPPTPSPGSTR